MKRRELSRALRVPDEEYAIFRQALEQMKERRQIVEGPDKRIALPQISGQVTGVYQGTSKGYGFVRPDQAVAQGDLYIPAGESLDAITGDRVVARVLKRGRREGQTRYTGRIVEVLDRGDCRFVGVLQKGGRQWFVKPDGKGMRELISVGDPGAKNARQGDKVLVEVVSFPTKDYYAEGVIIERLGKSGTNKAELKAVIRRYHLEDKFSRAALHYTRQAGAEFDVEMEIAKGGREDIRDQTIITIDPEDARDFDDAISIKKLPQGGWQLGVHIADVSNFVREGSALDKEARLRGTSVYLPHHVIPMLPEVLSNGVCSLQENQGRFVKSAYMKFDQKGNVLATRFANSVISSTRRLTYEDAERILDGNRSGFDEKTVRLLKKMEKLAKILQKRRQKEGMLTLDIPKADLIYNERGQVIDAQPESSSFPHTIIEMFMVEANEAVARLLDSLNVPFLRRIHPEPDALVTGDMAKVIKLCGYVIPKNIDRKGLQQLLASAAGKPESFVINLAVLKSLQRAEYSPAHLGHYALASKHYCHFTSPIRRYPDLLVHRLLQAYLEGRLTKETVDRFAGFDELMELGRHCSATERNAEQAENDLRSLKILQMLEKRIGEDTLAVVTTITNFGLFVQLEKYLIEGLIKADDVSRIKDSRQGRGKRKLRQKYSRKNNKFAENCPYILGQEIRVRIAGVNPAGRTLDLVPVE